MNETQRLIGFVHGLRFEHLPAPVVHRAKLLLLDHFGVSLFGSRTRWAEIAARDAGRFAAIPESTIYGRPGRVAAEMAALANGIAAHGYELDDSHEGGYSHPGAPVVATAFGLAEALVRTGADLLVAMAAGYEVVGRVGNALGAEGIRRHHPTGQLGVFGAVAAASKLQPLGVKQTSYAFGLAGSMAAGLMQFADDPEGTMVKRLHGGWPAHGGIIASRLASQDFTGPAQVLEGRFGFLRSITECFDVDAVAAGLGETWELMRTAVKLYPTCRAFHPMIEAIENLRSRHRLSAGMVSRISVAAPSRAITQQMIYEPRSLMSAQYSLPFVAAWALHRDSSDVRSFDEATIADAEILQTAKCVTAYLDEEIDTAYPRYAARMEVVTRDGRVLREEVWDAKGSSLKPASEADIVRKFLHLSEGVIRDPARVVDAVMNIETARSMDSLAIALQAGVH